MSRRPFLLPLAHYASSYRRTVFLVDSASSDSVPSELTLGHLPTVMLSLSGWLLRVLRVPPADLKKRLGAICPFDFGGPLTVCGFDTT